MPVIVTVLPLPTFLVSKLPLKEPVSTLTASVPKMPDELTLPMFNVAVVLPSYILSLAVIPLNVTVALLIVNVLLT